MRQFLMLGALLFTHPALAGVIRVNVQGMVCGYCTQGIHRKFSAVTAVKTVAVDFDQARVTLGLNPGSDLSDDQIAEILKDSGFTAGKIERD